MPIQAAARHDYEAFFRAESAARREHLYPPHGHLIAVRVDDPDERRATESIGRLATIARRVATERVEILGPSPAPIGRLRTRYRFRFMLRSDDRRALRQVGAAVAHAIDEGVANPSRASVDVDPVSML